MLRITLFALLICNLSWAKSTAPASLVYSTVSSPCTEKERWKVGTRVRQALGEKINDSVKDLSMAQQSILEAVALRDAAKAPESRQLMEFWNARSLLQLSLNHLSVKVFNTLLESENTIETQSIKIASLSCLNRMRQKFPNFGITPDAYVKVQELYKSPKIDRISFVILQETIVNYSQRRLASTAEKVDLSSEINLLKGSGSYESFVKFLHSARNEGDAEMVQNGRAFLDLKALPASIKANEDFIRLNLGRALYGRHQYKLSIDELKKISQSSNYFAQALNALGWANLLANRHTEAVGTASNLMLGTLRKTFAPDAYAVTSIALHETCNHKESLATIKLFKRSYGKSFQWLSSWRARESANPDVSLYSTVVNFLRKTKEVPDRVGTEWIRSPVFLANQDELNLLIDEKKTVTDLWKRFSLITRKKDGKKYSAALTTLKPLFQGFLVSVAVTEKKLIQEIDADLRIKSRRMLSEINDVAENLHRVEIDAYNLLGEKIVTENVRSNDSTSKPEEKKNAKKSDQGNVWNWGKFSTDGDEGAEFWEDELGYLKAEIKDKCSRK